MVFVFPDNASPSLAPDVPVSCLSYLTSFSGYLGTKYLGAQLSKKAVHVAKCGALGRLAIVPSSQPASGLGKCPLRHVYQAMFTKH